MNKKNDFLGTEPVNKLLVKLSLPAITGQVINLLYNMVDRIYIGHMPGDGALALTAVGVCMPLITIISAFAALASNGSAPQASIEMGAGNQEKAELILGNSFSMQIIISSVITFFLLVFTEPVLLAFGASQNTISLSTAYMRIYAVGTIFVQMTLGMNSFISAQGFAKTSMRSVLIGAICNIILDPLFIYGCKMGVQGAALATIISQGISMVWVLCFLTGPKTVWKIQKKNLRIKKEIVLSGMALGLAPFFMQASGGVVVLCLNAVLMDYGGDLAVGAMTILSSALQFSLLPMQGIGQGAQPIMSYSFGAGNMQRVKKTYRLLLCSNLCISFAFWAWFVFFPELFVMIFTTDKELLSFTSWALSIYMAGTCFFGAQIACQMAFIALGNAKASIMVAVMRKFVLLLPLVYIFPRFMEDKVAAVYMAEPVADVIAVCFTMTLFWRQYKKIMKWKSYNA